MEIHRQLQGSVFRTLLCLQKEISKQSNEQKVTKSYLDNKFRKNSLRLKDFDYSKEGAYFITICVSDHKHVFGEIISQKMTLNNAGKIVHDSWLNVENDYGNVALDEFIVMPNHFHAIIVITADLDNRDFIRQSRLDLDNYRNMIYHDCGQMNKCRGSIHRTQKKVTKQKASMTRSPQLIIYDFRPVLSKIVRYFKGRTTYILHRSGFEYFKWQRNYYDHIIRNEKDFLNAREYVFNNPLKWAIDKENWVFKNKVSNIEGSINRTPTKTMTNG